LYPLSAVSAVNHADAPRDVGRDVRVASDLRGGSRLQGCPLVGEKIGPAARTMSPDPGAVGKWSAALRAALLRRPTGHTVTITITMSHEILPG